MMGVEMHPALACWCPTYCEAGVVRAKCVLAAFVKWWLVAALKCVTLLTVDVMHTGMVVRSAGLQYFKVRMAHAAVAAVPHQLKSENTAFTAGGRRGAYPHSAVSLIA